MENVAQSSRHKALLSFSPWFPYAVCACLMIMGMGQTVEVFRLDSAIHSLQTQNATAQDDASRLRASISMTNLRLAMLEVKDPAFAAAKIMLAWDPYQHQGAIAFDGLPAAPTGHDYQLWVLDPNAAAPVSAGILTNGRPFSVPPISVQNPGFAITVEPTGGSTEPSSPILFAVAPGS